MTESAPISLPTDWAGVSLVVTAVFLGIGGLYKIWSEIRVGNRETVKIHAVVNGSNTVLLEAISRLTAKIAALDPSEANLREAETSETAAAGKRATIAETTKLEAP